MTRSESFESDGNLGIPNNSCACSLKVIVKMSPDILFSLGVGSGVEALKMSMVKSTPKHTIHRDSDGTGKESQRNGGKNVSFSLEMYVC